MRSLLFLSALCGLCTAHFELRYPKSIGFKDENEDKGPCGGYTPDLSGDLVDFHVGGEAIATRLTHQQCNWLLRVTTDEKAETGWEQIFPIVQQSGLGDFCQPAVTIPEKYVGKKGIVSVVSSAVDGLLYQCIAANFVKGSADAPSECKNASSVKASFTDDKQLSALVGDTADSDSASTGSDSSSTSETSSAPSSTESSGAMVLGAWSTTGFGLGNVVVVFTMALVGGALMV